MAKRQQVQSAPSWGTVVSTAQLPNVAAATIQSAQLEAGDTCYVNAGNIDLYVCIDATLGAAIWRRLSSTIAASMSSSLGQAVATGVDTTIDFNATDFDTSGIVDLVNNRFNIAVAGIYQVSAISGMVSSADGLQIGIRIGGVTYISATAVFLTGTSIATVISMPIQLAAGAQVDMFVRQNSGIGQNTSTGTDKPRLALHMV